MKYNAFMLVVSDMEKSRAFYEKLLGLKVAMDLGVNVSYDCLNSSTNRKMLSALAAMIRSCTLKRMIWTDFSRFWKAGAPRWYGQCLPKRGDSG